MKPNWREIAAKVKEKKAILLSTGTALSLVAIFQNCGAMTSPGTVTPSASPTPATTATPPATHNLNLVTTQTSFAFSGSTSNPFTLTNLDSVSATNFQVTPNFSNGGFTLATTGGSECSNTGTLLPGKSCTVTVNFTGTSTQSYDGSITVSYADPTGAQTGSTTFTVSTTASTPTPSPISTFKAGTYLIQSVASGLCLSKLGGLHGEADQPSVVPSACNPSVDKVQIWNISALRNSQAGQFELGNPAAQKCITLTGFAPQSLTPLSACYGIEIHVIAPYQAWEITPHGAGYIFTSKLNSGGCLDISTDNTLITNSCDNRASQQFKLIPYQ